MLLLRGNHTRNKRPASTYEPFISNQENIYLLFKPLGTNFPHEPKPATDPLAAKTVTIALRNNVGIDISADESTSHVADRCLLWRKDKTSAPSSLHNNRQLSPGYRKFSVDKGSAQCFVQ